MARGVPASIRISLGLGTYDFRSTVIGASEIELQYGLSIGSFSIFVLPTSLYPLFRVYFGVSVAVVSESERLFPPLDVGSAATSA